MSIFEKASREKFRFATPRGELTTEQLWDLPLTNPRGGGLDLDSVARAVNTELKGVTEESFVATKPNPQAPALEAKLEVVKHIIAVRQREAEDARKAAARQAERRKLAEALANKKDQAIAQMSEEDILKRLNDLDAAE